ncbi:glycoside hydrolase family 27 protein [Oidiodendron maius Zn]|uniref:Alpha-galactosidase n=1 Tax=Oidiodendron maius (strain Zn) TaxID=913774 RepID=A0A0C3H4W5_OIDMZ|nr:glycoside hydrolase family 27 protein [Oidiodendron maius Zn]
MIGQAPQMGWNTWNTFHANYNATVVEQTVSLLNSLGLKEAGYEYVVLDEGWQASSRTADGYLQINSTSFPGGIKSIVDYVHDHGLKIGLYGDSGMLTCGFNPGSYGYEIRDAITLAEWEIDYWKYDNCGGFAAMTEAPEVRFGTMKDALALSGRDILYSVCEWGYQFPWHWGGDIGHSYRMSGDITASFVNETGCACKTAYCLNTGYAGCSVVSIIQKMREISQYQTPGHWADMDMLEIGNGNMTLAMQQTHFAFWSALKSPLIIGADLSKLDNDSISVLTNRDIIALNQDPLGVAVNYIESASEEGSIQIWTGPVRGGNVVLVFNEKSYPQTVTVSFDQLNLNISGNINAKELWSGKQWKHVEQVGTILEPYQTMVFQLS